MDWDKEMIKYQIERCRNHCGQHPLIEVNSTKALDELVKQFREGKLQSFTYQILYEDNSYKASPLSDLIILLDDGNGRHPTAPVVEKMLGYIREFVNFPVNLDVGMCDTCTMLVDKTKENRFEMANYYLGEPILTYIFPIHFSELIKRMKGLAGRYVIEQYSKLGKREFNEWLYGKKK